MFGRSLEIICQHVIQEELFVIFALHFRNSRKKRENKKILAVTGRVGFFWTFFFKTALNDPHKKLNMAG